MDDPVMPARPPVAALKAIDQIRAYRSWEPIEVYTAIREALLLPHEDAPPAGMPGTGEPPVQG